MAPTRTRATRSAAVAEEPNALVGQPATLTQSSRKGKKAWRKNIDLTSTEAYLEESRDPLRQTQSDSLFVEDRRGQETTLARQARTKKPLKSLEILQKNHGHPAIERTNRTRKTDSKAKKDRIDPALEAKLRRMVGRQNRPTEQGDKSSLADHSSAVVQKSLGQVYNVWNSESSPADIKGKSKLEDSVEADWIPSLVTKPAPHPPSTLRQDSFGDLSRKIPAIQLPHPGTSYNPDLESHEQLIQQVYEIEKKLENQEQMDQKERESWQKKLKEIVAREAELRAEKDDAKKRYAGMQVDLPTESTRAEGDEEEDDDDEDDDNDTDDRKGSSREPKRKTSAQRRREHKAYLEKVAAAERKAARIQAASVYQLSKHQKRQAALQAARQEAIEARRRQKALELSSKGLAGKKIGKNKVEEPKLDVQIPEDLSESLRTLKQEGNLFRDRYINLQSRALIEPRTKQEPKKRKFKLKEFESHDYKRFS